MAAGLDLPGPVKVDLGPSHSSGYASVSWSGRGGSGTIACPCGDPFTFTTSALNPVVQRITVTAKNTRGRVSNPGTSNQVQPYGPTPKPTASGSNASGKDVSYSWNLPTDGRPITRVTITGDGPNYDGDARTSWSFTGGAFSTTYCINITAYSAAGASPTLQMCQRTDNPPPADI